MTLLLDWIERLLRIRIYTRVYRRAGVWWSNSGPVGCPDDASIDEVCYTLARKHPARTVVITEIDE